MHNCLTNLQCVATLFSESCTDLSGTYAHIGHRVNSGMACCSAILVSSPITALPSGHCSARGRKFCGRDGGLAGFGIRTNHPVCQLLGMMGGDWVHQSCNKANRIGAKGSARPLQIIPGAQSGATALVAGICLSAAVRSCTSNGMPGVIFSYHEIHDPISAVKFDFQR